MEVFSNIVFLAKKGGPNIPLFIVLIVFAALCLVGAAIIVIYMVKSGKKEKTINNETWLLALGGKENVSSIKGVGSRLSVVVNDKEKLDRQKLKELGVSSILTMSDKLVLVIEGKAENIAKKLNI